MFKQLKPGAHIHLMGICGTAMASLAGLLKDQGFYITGSDQNVYPPMSTQLENLGIKIMEGYKRENLNKRPDLVIVGNVMTRKHEEVVALLETDIPYTSLPKSLGEVVIANRDSVVIAGTHGKTTTTSLMAWIATCCEKKPGFLIGGIPLNFSRSFQNPEGNVFVIEGDEYDTAFFDKVPKFIHYKPKFVVLTSVEFDHADIYPDLDAVKSSFRQLLELIPSDGVLLYNGNDVNIKSILKFQKNGKSFSYSLNGESDYIGKITRKTPDFAEIDVYFKKQKLVTVQTTMFGDYNIENMLADIGLAHQMGWPLNKVADAIKSFRGVKRRQEIIGKPNNITIIDDFAHHPTAVQVTVKAVQERFQGHKVISIFEPRSATSRRAIFQEDYLNAFRQCDHLLLADVFNKKALAELNVKTLEPSEIVENLKKEGRPAELMPNTGSIVERVKQLAKPGDVVLIMSNGGFDGLHQKLVLALSN